MNLCGRLTARVVILLYSVRKLTAFSHYLLKGPLSSSVSRPSVTMYGEPEHSVRPIVWTIAGSDSGGGAGIQADLHTMHDLGVHGCSVITAMTAQNSHAVTHVEYVSAETIRATIAALESDLPPAAVKLGMMGTDAASSIIEDFLNRYEGNVVFDPVMISTSGARLMTKSAEARMAKRIFPRATVITPNLVEAEILIGRRLKTPEDVEEGAVELLASSQARGVLIKGRHAAADDDSTGDTSCSRYAQDYWTNGTPEGSFWLTSPWVDNKNTHGTGCTLSSAMVACMARGLDPMEAVVIAKAYVTQGIQDARRLGEGPGPVAQTGWPARADCFPWVTVTAQVGAGRRPKAFPRCKEEWGLYPLVNTAEWVEKLLSLGVRDIQLRVKKPTSDDLDAEVEQAERACRAAGGRLWVNDYWRTAIKHGTYGVHLGQEDLQAGGGEALRAILGAGLRLGVSTHTYLELARAMAVRPSYVSLGPVYGTSSKTVVFSPRGSGLVRVWRSLVDTPLIAIGGIRVETAPEVLEAGADGIAAISGITEMDDLSEAVRQWNSVFEANCRKKAQC